MFSSITFTALCLLLIWCFTVITCAPNPTLRQSNDGQLNADSYKLALQWANSLCNNVQGRDCIRQVPQRMIIHALLPFDKQGKILPNCVTGASLEDFRSHMLGIPGLSENWKNLFAGQTDFQLWKQQWWKHGRCLGLWPRDYFEKGVKLKHEIERKVGGSLIQLFINKGLRPSDRTLYNPQRFTIEIFANISLVTELNCNWNENVEAQFYEVRFCVDKNWVLANCQYYHHHHNNKRYQQRAPTFKATNCYSNGSMIHFPPAPLPSSPPPPPPPPCKRSSPPRPKAQPPPPPPISPQPPPPPPPSKRSSSPRPKAQPPPPISPQPRPSAYKPLPATSSRKLLSQPSPSSKYSTPIGWITILLGQNLVLMCFVIILIVIFTLAFAKFKAALDEKKNKEIIESSTGTLLRSDFPKIKIE